MSRRYQHIISKLTALLIAAVVLFSVNSLQATHIVGSDMSFECLGNDFYEITLVVRRDCINGADDAPFDDPASVGIYDASGNPLNFLGSLGQVMLPFAGENIIDPGRPDCGYFGGPVCVEEAVYTARVYLPFRARGYILAYQRCCRNVTLNNIINPLETGTTKFVCLTETTLNECNSSPEFQEWPEIVVCSDQPIAFDHAAFDKDGDSLAYHLFTPNSGATIDFPKPQKPSFPPYNNDTVTFAQGYGLDNLLGGVPLQIDPISGQITALPNTVGQFLVGILVEEWRDGELLSKVRRDFEYNVRVCEDIAEISFDAPELTCDGLTVQVDNTSIDDFGYTWNFNYPSDDAAFISTDASPAFTYPEAGFYTISLSSANPENDCEVVILKEIGVFNSQITTDISCTVSACVDGEVSIFLQSNAIEPLDSYEISAVNWTIVAGDQVIPANGDSITVSIPCTQEIAVTLNVTSETGCMASQSKTINVNFIEVVIDDSGDVLTICEGDSIALLNSSQDSVFYDWTPTTGLTFTDTIFFSDPIASPDTTTKYTVEASNGMDVDMAMILVVVNPNPIYDITTDTLVVCEGSTTGITITSEQDLTYIWEGIEGINASDPQNPLFSPSVSTSYTVSISNGPCTIEETVYIEVIPTEVDEVGSDIEYVIVYDSLSMGLSIEINEEELRTMYDIVSVRWEVMAGNDMFAGNGSSIDVILSPDVEIAKVTYYFTDSSGCEYSITTIVVISGGEDGIIDIAGDTLYICVGESVALLNSSILGLKYNWSPLEGLMFTDLINFSDPIASPTDDTEYTVTVAAANLSDTATVLVIVNDLPVVNISMDSIEICEGAGVDITLSSDEDLIFDWGNQAGVNITSPYSPSNPFLNPSETTTYTVNVSNEFCTIEKTIVVNVIPTEVDEVDEEIEYVFNYDSTTMGLTVSINEEDLLSSFDIVSIRWEVMAGDEMFAGEGSSIDVTLPDARFAKITYFFTDSEGCEYAITRILPLLGDNERIIDIAGDTLYICTGESVSLLNSTLEGLMYKWEPIDGLTFMDLVNFSDPLASPDMTTEYTVTVTNSLISDTAKVLVIVSPDPVYSISMDSLVICEGAGMSINIDSDQDLILVWEDAEGINVSDPFSPSNPNFTPKENTSYIVSISNGVCSIMDTINIEVIPTEVDEVTESIVYTTTYDTLSGNLTISINEEELRSSYDIVSIRWTVMAGEEMFAGEGSDIDVIITDADMAKVTYYFTDSMGCEYEITMIIDLGNNNIPMIEFTMQDTILACLGDSTAIIANPNSEWTYTWEPEDDLVFTSEEDKSDPVFVGDTSRQYVVTVDNGLISVTDSVFVKINTAQLMLSFESELGTICDDITNLRVVNPDNGDATTYEWSLTSTFDRVVSSEQFVAIVIDTDSARVFVRADDPRFCGSNVAFIDVFKDSLDLSVEFDPIDLCTLVDTTTVAVINNNLEQMVSIKWEANERIISDDLESNTITVRANPSDSEITLTYVASDGIGCVITEDVIIPVNGVLSLDVVGDSLLCDPMPMFSVSSQESDATYEWSLSSMFDEIIATGSDVTLDLPSGSSTLFVRGSHPDYCGSETDSIQIQNNAPDFSLDFEPLNICVSNSTSVDLINNDPSQTLSIVWASSENIVSDPLVLPIQIVALEGQTQIVLDYTLTNNLGCELMESLTIPVEDELVVDIAIDSVSCDGTTGTFAAIVNASMASYEWSLDPDFGSILSTDSIVIVSLPEGQSIYLRASTDLCQSNVASTSLPQDPFMITSNAPDSICIDDTFELIADGGVRMFSIVWEASDNILTDLDSNVISIVGLDNGAESIVLTYSAISIEGCETSGMIEIPYGSIVAPDPIVSVNCGTYGLTFDTGSGFSDGDILWDFGISDDDSDISTAGSPSFDFGAPGVYTVMVSSMMDVCQFDPFSIEVFVPEIITLESNDPLSVSKCDGDTVLSIGAMTNLDFPIIWTSIDGDTISVSDSLTFSSADFETVIATVMDTFGCSQSLTFTIDAYEFGLEVQFPNGPDASACAGESFPISIVDTTGANLSYDWSPAANILTGQGSADVTVALDGPTELSVLVTNLDNGCTTEIKISPNVVFLDVEVVADPDAEIFLGESVTIIAESDGDIVTYTWDNGSSDASQIVSPTETTTYIVTVTDINGCTATGQITIVVIQPECDENDVYLPTAFSPNGDNTNDVLIVRSNFVDEMDLQVVDRWGEEVFRSTNQRDGWNGMYKGTGRELSPDVYAYCLKVVCVDGQEFIKTGKVSLIR